jgi:chromosome segregation ATPase
MEAQIRDREAIHEKRIRLAKQRIDTLENSIATLKAARDASKREIVELKSRYNERIAQLAMTEENAKLEEQITRLQQELEDQKGTGS